MPQTIPLNDEQIEEAKRALLVLSNLFGGPYEVMEIRCVAGELITARVCKTNSKGERYVVHSTADDVCPCSWSDEDERKCTCGMKTGELADEWVKAQFVCRAPSTEGVGSN